MSSQGMPSVETGTVNPCLTVPSVYPMSDETLPPTGRQRRTDRAECLRHEEPLKRYRQPCRVRITHQLSRRAINGA